MTENKLPYVRFYMSDWLSATRGMKANEIGIYFTLIALMYERGEPVPENYDRLSRQCGCIPNVCEKTIKMLIEDGKIVRLENGLWNKRVQKEFEFRQEKSRVSSEAASARWEKDNNINDDSMRTHSERNADAMPIPEARSQNINSSSNEEHNTRAKKPIDVLSQVLDQDHSQAIIEHRNKIKKPLSERAANLLANELRKCASPNEAADEIILRGWTGFKADWLTERRSFQSHPKPKSEHVLRHEAFEREINKVINGDRNEPDSNVIDLTARDYRTYGTA